MRKLLVCFWILALARDAAGQNNVFVLVDVSKSIQRSQLDNARDALREILRGAMPGNFNLDSGNAANISGFALQPNDRIMIMRFGDKATIMGFSPDIRPISSPGADIDPIINNQFPLTPTDNWTFISLAKARLVKFARDQKIDTFRLIFISDNNSDNYGGHPGYDSVEQGLVSEYNTTKNPLVEEPAIVFTHRVYHDYQIRIGNVCLQKPGHGIDPNVYKGGNTIPQGRSLLSIKINAPVGGHTKQNYYESPAGSLHFSWVCGAPGGVGYVVDVVSADDGGFHKSEITAGSAYDLELKDGKYQISVRSNSNDPQLKILPANTYVEVGAGGGGAWLIILIVLLVLGGAGWWVLDDQRRKRLERQSSKGRGPDLFAREEPAHKTPGNTDYF